MMAESVLYQAPYYRALLRTEGPLFAFLAPWLVVLVAKEFAWTTLIRPIYSSAYILVIANLFGCLLLAFLYDLLWPRSWVKGGMKNPFDSFSLPPQTGQVIFTSLALVWILEIAQVIYFEGFPLLWIAQGSIQNYTDYGIPSVNGALHALFLSMTTALFVWQLTSPSYKKKALLMACCLLPVLLVHRALFMALALQMACCALFLRPAWRRRIWVSGVVVLGLFIVVGNLRTGMQKLLLVYPPSEQLPEVLYPLLWIYAYIVTPFNNLNMNADTLEPLSSFHWQLQAILPKALHPALASYGIGKGEGFDVDFPGQVHTFYYEPVLDFGLIYAGLFMTATQAITLRAYYRLQEGPTLHKLLLYSVFYQIAVLSIFCNFLLFPPIIFQIVCLLLLRERNSLA